MSFKNRWKISSSYGFQANQLHSQRGSWVSQSALLWFKVLPDLSPALPGAPTPVVSTTRPVAGTPMCFQACWWHFQTCYQRFQVLSGVPKVLTSAPRCSQTNHNHPHGTPVPVIRDPSSYEGRQECPPRVWYSSEIDTSKFRLHILSDTPGGFQWLKWILLMSPYENAQLVDLEWTEHKQSEQIITMEWYTSQGSLEALKVYRLLLACMSVMLGGYMHHNMISGQWNDDWAFHWSVQSPQSDGWEIYIIHCQSMHLQWILNSTTSMNYVRCLSSNWWVMKMNSLVYLLHKRQCTFVLFLNRFIICSSDCTWIPQMIWIDSTCVPKWEIINIQKFSVLYTQHQPFA